MKYIIFSNRLLLYLLLINHLSCKKEGGKTSPVIDVFADFQYVNSNGDPAITRAQFEALKVFYIIDGKTIQASATTGSEKGFIIISSESGSLILRVFPFPFIKTEEATVLLQFPNGDVDKIIFSFDHPNDISAITTAVFYNGSKVWGNSDAYPNSKNIKIIK